MTSLRAISTLPKRAKVLSAVALLFFLFPLLLSAETFDAAVLGESGSYVSLLKDVLSSFTTLSGEKVLSLREERRSEEKRKNELVTRTNESRNEKWSDKKNTTVTPYTSLTMRIVDVDLSEYKDFLSRGDRDADEYLRRKNNLDAIFYVSSKEDGNSEYIELFFNGESIRCGWYNGYLVESEEKALYELMCSILLSSEWAVYSVSVIPEDATLLLDGETIVSDKKYLVLKSGRHTFSLSSYGYESRIYTYDLDGEEREISLSLDSAEPFNLFVSTYPFESEIYFNGIKQDKKLIEGIYTPYSITLTSPLFSRYSYQERKRNGHVTLYLSPSWMDNAPLVGDKKASFYSSLFYLLLSFGGYSASEAVSNYYSENIGTITKVVFTGLSVVSLVELIQSAVDYYNSAQMGL